MKVISSVVTVLILVTIFMIPVVLTLETTTIPETTSTTTTSTTTLVETTTSSTTTIEEETTTVEEMVETTLVETTTIPETTSTTTVEATTSSTTTTLQPKPKDKKPPVWSNLRHEPSVVKESESVNIIVGWYDNVELDTVIIYENSTGVWVEHLCDKETGHCSLGIVYSSMISDFTSSFLIFVFVVPFTFVMSTLMKMVHVPKIVLPFLGLIVAIFLLSILLFPEVARNISIAFSRLGIIPLGAIKTFSHTISASELNVGEVVGYYSYANDTAGNEAMTEIKTFTVQSVEAITKESTVQEEIEIVSVKEEHEKAEIDKPVKWRKELVVINPSIEGVKDYNVIGVPEDAKSIIVKDETGTIIYRDKTSWETDIAGEKQISYFVEYETPAPYKVENEVKPFVSGKTYKKRINVKSDFIGHYQNVKAYTDIPEELSEENYKIRLYRVFSFSKVDVTDDPAYDVKFVDSDNDGINDRVEWNVPMLSNEEFEVKASITIINVQSYPTVFGNWTVRFNTTGKADLTITPIDNTNFDVDIQFLELQCGNNKVNPVYDGKSVFYANWSCSEEGMIINKVLKPGKHTLEFRYGDDVEYAYNMAILEKAMVAYRSNTGNDLLNSPKVKVWNNETGWGDEIELPSAGSPIRFVKLAFSPISSERIIVTLSDDGYLDAYVSKYGISWNVTNDIGSTGTITNAYRSFDIAYEKTTGRALLVYSRGTTTDEIGYKIWDGNSWSGENLLDLPYTTGRVNWIALASKPTTNANQIAMIYIDSNVDVHGYEWTGSSWSLMGVLSIWDSSAAIATEECIAVAYEQTSGEAMFIWADATSRYFYYRTWNGAALTGPTSLYISTAGGVGNWVRLKPQPASDGLLFMVIDGGSDLNTRYWDGSSWTAHSEHDSGVDTNAQRCADFSWNPDGSSGVLIWDTDRTGTSISYRTCTPPNCAGTILTTSPYAARGRWIQAVTNPRDEDNTKILIGRLNSNPYIGSINRSSTDFSNYPPMDYAITANVGDVTYEAFDISFLLVEPTYGWLNGTLDIPNPNIYTAANPLELSQYDTFTVNATIECKDESCGSVSGSVRYNNSLNEPDVLMSTTKGSTPFYIVDPVQARDDDYVYKNWNFSVADRGISRPSGIAYNGTHFWITNRSIVNSESVIYRYNKNGDYDNWYITTTGQTVLEGIYVNSTSIGVTSNSGTKNVAFFDINTGNLITAWPSGLSDVPSGIVFNASYVWIIQSGSSTDRVYRYNSDGSSQTLLFDLCTTDPNSPCCDSKIACTPDGLEWNGTHWFILNSANGRVYAYNSTGYYANWNFSVSSWPYDLDWEESEKNFYIVGLYDNYVRRYEKNIVGTNPIACGYMNQNDFCQLNWLVNVTGSSGDYKIDVNFSSSYYPNVANNDTLNSYIRIKSSPSFAIKLPGQSWILSSKTKPGTLTTPIEFNATSKTEYDVVPCVYGYSCNPGYIQDATTPIFNFTNTGGKAEKWNISLSQALPSYIHLYGNTVNSRTGENEINTTGWIAASNIPAGGYAQVWLWADFVDALPGSVDITINHTSMSAT